MKINYQITALTPLFTGSDENTGTTRKLRRETRMITPVEIQSNFATKNERRKALMNVVFPIYKSIDAKLKSGNYGFYEAYANKIKSALGSPTKTQFLNTLLESLSISVMSSEASILVRKSIDKFSDIEFIASMKDEFQYLNILLREYVEAERKNILNPTEIFKDIFDEAISKKEKIYTDRIPYVGGNSIRGVLRRLTMRDFVKQIGIEKLDKNIYHQLFTGGNLNSSTSIEDIRKRENYIDMCPAIGLFGSAIGNMTIEGEMKVNGARLQCKENGTGDISYWQLLSTVFGTRLDSSKMEKQLEIEGNTKDVTQMKYEFEVFITGSVFDSAFFVTTDDKLLVSAFWRTMELYKEFAYLGGNSATDSGNVDINIEIPKNATKLYLDYLKKNKKDIKAYFDVG